MVSVRLVCAETYQAVPIPGLDPTYSEFRGSEVKHVPIIRIFGSTSNGEKTCLHIHGVFPYMYIPYTGGEESHSLAYRLAASLDTAINVSLGSASCHNQHVFKIQLISGIPFYGYHEKEHQFFKVYFYNPAMIKRAANLLQNGTVLNGCLQPYEAHIPFIQQFMIDFNLHGMNMVDLQHVKHRMPSITFSDQDINSEKNSLELDNVDYLPETVLRQTTCKLEIDALASDILNRREIENELAINPGLATIWEEEKARRLKLNLSGGDSQLVNPKSPTRPFVVTENDLFQQQRLANRLSTISQQSNDTFSVSMAKTTSSYPLETDEEHNLLNASHLEHHIGPCSKQSHTGVFQKQNDVDNSIIMPNLSLSAIPCSRESLDCSILDADDIPLINLLNELAYENACENIIDDNSQLGSQTIELAVESKCDSDSDEVEDLNLTSLQLDSLSLSQHSRLSQKSGNSKANSDQRSVLLGNLSVFDMDTDLSSDDSTCDNIPQYDGAGDVLPVLKTDKKEPNSAVLNHSLTRRVSDEIISMEGSRASQYQKVSKIQIPSCSTNTQYEIDFDLDLPSTLPQDHYLDGSHGIFNEQFTQLSEEDTNFDSDLENLQSTMEIDLLSPNTEEIGELNNQSTEDRDISIDKVLTGDPCFTESAVFDKSDITELQDQYVSLLGNALLTPSIHGEPCIDLMNTRITETTETASTEEQEKRKCVMNTKLIQNSMDNRNILPLENITPNIQNLNNQMQTTVRANSENCKDQEERLTPPDSDYNCNVVATWEELQNLRFVDKQSNRRKNVRKNESESVTNRSSDIAKTGSRRLRHRREINSLPYPAHQKDIHLHVGKYSQNENVKLSGVEKNYTDVETVRNNVNRKVYTRNKFSEVNLINARKNQSYSSYKFYKSKRFIENKLNQCKAIDLYVLGQDDNNVSTRQHELGELSDIFDINAHTLEDVRSTLSGVHYSLHPLNKNQTLVDSILADFKADEEVEFSSNVDKSSSGTTSNASTYISHYSCKRSHHNVAEKRFTHSHAMINRRGKIVPQSVYSPNNLWVIEKRKVGKPKLPEQNCENVACKLPTILIEKLNVDGLCNGFNIKQTSNVLKNNKKFIENSDSMNICYTDKAVVENSKNCDPNLKTSPTNNKKISSPKSRLFCEFDEESNDNSFLTSEESKNEIQEFSKRRITRISRLKHEQITKNLFAKCSSSNESNCTTSHLKLDTNNSSAMTNEVTSDASSGEEPKMSQTVPITRLKTPIIRRLLPIRKMNGLKKRKPKLVVLTIKNNSHPEGDIFQYIPNGQAITSDHAALSISKHDCNVQDRGKKSSIQENSRSNVDPNLLANDMMSVTDDKVAEKNSTWNDLVQPTIPHSSTSNTHSLFVQRTVMQNDSHNLIPNLSHHVTSESQLVTKPDIVNTEKQSSDKTSTLHKLKILLEKRIDDKLINVSSDSSLLQSLLSQGQNDDKSVLKNICNRKSSKLKNYPNHSDRYSLDSSNFTSLTTDPHTTDQMGDPVTGSSYDNITSKPDAVNPNTHDETVDAYANVNDSIFNENDNSTRALSTFTEAFVYEPTISDALPSANMDTFSSSILDSCTQVMQTLDSSCIAESRPTTEAGIEELILENQTNLEFTEHNFLNNDGKTCFSPSREYAVDVITSEIPKCLFEEDSSSDEDEDLMKKDDVIANKITQVEGCDTSYNQSVDCLPDHQNLDVFDIDNLISDTVISDTTVDTFRPATSEEVLQNKNHKTSKENISDDNSNSINQVLNMNSKLEDNDVVCDTTTTVVDSESNNNVIIDVSNENVTEFENLPSNEITEKNMKDNLVSLVNNKDCDNTAFMTAYEEEIESQHLTSNQITNTEGTEDKRLSPKISDPTEEILNEINVQSSHLCSDIKKVQDAADNVQCEKYLPESVVLNIKIDTNSNGTDKSTDCNETQSTAEKDIKVRCLAEKQVNINSQEQLFDPQNKVIKKTCSSDQDITNKTSCLPCSNNEEQRSARTYDIDKKLKLVSIQLEKIDVLKLGCLVKRNTNADEVQLSQETNDIELKIGSSQGNSTAQENTCLPPRKSKSKKRVRFDDNVISIPEVCQGSSLLSESCELLPPPPENNSEQHTRNMPKLLQPRRESIRMKQLSLLPNKKTQYSVNSPIIPRTCSSVDRTSENDEALNDALENFSSTYQETIHKRMNSRSLSIVKCLEKYDKKVQIIKPDPKLLVVKIKCNETRWVNTSRKQRFMARLGLYRADSSNLIFCSKPPATAFVQLKIPKVVLKRLDSSVIKRYEISKTGNCKQIMRKHHGRCSICQFQIPACDGAADGSSSDSEQEQDLTLERHEKRICDYKSCTKRSPLRLINLTPKKRNCTSENYRAENSSKKRRTNCASPKQLNDSQKISDLLSSPGCPSRSYSPLNIIVSSPQKRNDVRISSSQPSESQEEISELGSITPRRKLRQLRERVLRDNSSIRSPQSKDGNKNPNNHLEEPEVFGELHAIPSTSGTITTRETKNDLITSTIFRNISCDDTGITTRGSEDARKRLVFTFHKENRTEKPSAMNISDNDDNTLTNEQPRYLDSVGAMCIRKKLGSKVRNSERNIGKCLQDSSGRSLGIADNKSCDKLTLDVMANCNYFEEDDDTAANDLNQNDQSTTSEIERQKLVYKENEMQNSDDEELNLCNITFTQYIESQRTDNVQYFSSVDNYSKTQRNIVIRPKFNPPSREEIAESMESFNIPTCRNEKPFFGDHKDVMSEKEVAHQMLKVPSKSVLNLLLFKSELECITGIRRWRMMKVKEIYPAGAKLKLSEMKQNLTGQNKVLIKPLTNPPTSKSVKTWLRAKQYLKKLIENKNTSEENKNSTLTCTPQSESSSTPNSDTIETFNPSSSFQISKPDSSSRSELAEKTRKRCLVKRKFSEAEEKNCARRFSTSSHETNESNISIDASLQQALENSNLYKNQDPSRHFAVTFGQIETSSQADSFKIPCQNLQELKPITTHQFITILCLEVHTVTRGDLLPNPQYDAISAIFYAIQNDVPETSNVKPLEHGIIALDPQFDTSKTSGYLKGAAITCPVVYSANEEALLENLVSLILKCDPDILIGWELEFLSWGYVFQRAAVLGINLAPRVSRIPTTKQAWENQTTELNILTEIKMPGRIVLDIWRLMRHELALQSYTFENVTYHVMHQRISSPSFATLTRWWGHRTPRIRWMVVEHYINKVLGILKLLDHLDIIGKTSELARIYGIQFFEVFSRGSQFQVESVMLRLAKPSNYVPISPSVQQRASMRAPESLPLIMEPESVFYSDPLIVLDFQSLYPSIIIAHNYCYSTCLGRMENIGQPDPFEFGAATLKVTKRTASKLSGKVNFSPCGVAFVKPEVRKGILPRMLMEMIETRLMVKKAMKDHSKTDKALQRALFSRQLGLKLLANVTFGYTHANFSGRMPCIEIGDSIVSKARETLERAIHLVEANKKWNARVVYGDTDSLFIVVPGKSRKQAFQIGTEIADAVTADNPTPMKLKLEKIMHPAILQTKKRYCGYMYESPDQEIPVYLAKGIETVRRDGCPAVSKILEKTLRILFNTKDVSLVKSYVTRQLDKVLRGRVSLQDLTFAREFRGLQGYKSTACVPALELTQRLIQKDPRAIPRTSERVPYIIVAGAPNQPLFQCVKSPWEVLMDPGLRPNALYYITRVIIPPLNRCLNLLGVDVNVWFAEMPHRYIANYATTLRTNVQKSTISQYFGTVACAACGNNSKAGICTDCLTIPNQTLVVLHEKIRQMERTHSSIHAVCQSCIGRADNIECASLDCPILYRRLQTTNDSHQINYIRQIIDKGNSLEF